MRVKTTISCRAQVRASFRGKPPMSNSCRSLNRATKIPRSIKISIFLGKQERIFSEVRDNISAAMSGVRKKTARR